ncbi:MAG: hypothetical protein AAGA85_13830 [Bacteroidota bacterium]
MLKELKEELHEIIEVQKDSEKLKEVLALLKEPGIYKKLSLEEYAQEIDDAKAQVVKGDFISQEDLEDESEQW